MSISEHPGSELNSAVVDAHDLRLRITGRFDDSQPGKLLFAHSGVSLELAFEAESIEMELWDPKSADPSRCNHFAVLVDGQHVRSVATPNTIRSFTLAEQLSPGRHLLEVFKKTEASVGRVEFSGFRLRGSAPKTLPLPTPPSRMLEFIGDSITCGYGNEQSLLAPPRGSPETGFHSQNENHYWAYGAIAARALKARFTTVCVSGMGIYRNYGGVEGGQMPDAYPLIWPGPSAPRWNFRRFVPDAVVVNLGGNDFGSGQPDRARFEQEFDRLLNEVRHQYSSVPITLAVGPMVSDAHPPGGHHLTQLRTWVTSVLQRRQAAGDHQMSLLVFPVQSEPYGEDWHPSRATHQAMAAQLVEHLQPFFL